MNPLRRRTIDEAMCDLAWIEQMLQKAVRAALLRHRQAHNPVAVWRDGKVVWIQPEDIPVAVDCPAVSDVPRERPYNGAGRPSTGDES